VRPAGVLPPRSHYRGRQIGGASVKTQHGAPDEIEILIDEAGSAEVSIGETSRGRGRWLLAALAVVALLAFAATRSGTQPRSVATTSTSVGGKISSTVAATSVASAPPNVDGRQLPSQGKKVGPELPFGRATGAFIYLTPTGGAPTSFQIYNVDTGEARDLSFGTDIGWYIRAVDFSGAVVLDGGAVLAVRSDGVGTLADPANSSDYVFGRVASGPDNGLWVRDTALGKLRLFSADGSIAGEHDLPIGADLYGSMSDGRPVLRGTDLRSYVMDKLGTRRLLSSGLTSYVENGRYTETTCDDQQRCETVGHFDTQKRAMALPEKSMVRFQPEGPLIAIVQQDESLSLLNGVTGEVMPVIMTEHVPYDPTFPLATNVTFLPDGNGLVASTSSGHLLIDSDGKVVARLPNALNVLGASVIGSGRGVTRATS
jgi:hypothetical protein